jgi:hypothetical protein
MRQDCELPEDGAQRAASNNRISSASVNGWPFIALGDHRRRNNGSISYCAIRSMRPW